MAWKLRQFVEGDRSVTLSNVSDEISMCYIDESGNYIPNTIAIKIDNIEYSIVQAEVNFGFLSTTIPSSVFISSNTTIQVYCKCDNNPEYRSNTLTAKPINFRLTNDGITVCDNTVQLEAFFSEYVRLFVGREEGDYFQLLMTDMSSSTYLHIEDFSYQQGDNGNIISMGNNFSRPNAVNEESSLFSNNLYNTSYNLQINPLTTNYFTVRAGYVELKFIGNEVRYTNYLTDANELYLALYTTTDAFSIVSSNQHYSITKNNVEIVRIYKNIVYSTTGGIISPVNTLHGFPVTWTLPTQPGLYNITATFSESVKFNQTIRIHSCGTAVNDNYQGAYNIPFEGNVSLNDQLCIGETTYVQVIPNTTIGSQGVNLSNNGEFIFTPSVNFIGTGQFQYERYCGSEENGFIKVGSAIVNIIYEDSCTSLESEWEDTGREKCQNCNSFKEQRDLNFECTQKPNRWIPTNSDICVYTENWEDTNEIKCEYSHKYRKQINLNNCNPDKEQWIDLGISVDCDCIGEIFIDTCCGIPDYYPVVKLLNDPTEENRAINKCLKPNLGENCLKNKSLKFYSLNDGQSHDYLITIFDCTGTVISQIKFLDFNCAGEDVIIPEIPDDETFPFTFPFNLI